VHRTYIELYRMRTDRHWLHQKLVGLARKIGVKATAREFGCARNTVRKWLRRQTGFGAQRLPHEFALPCSHNAIARILRHHQLGRPRKQKPVTKKLLRAVKRHWKLFGQLSTDTKYLQDIPHYWLPMTRLKLPRFQYTAREPVSGACFTGYADELSKSYATFLAEQLSVHLAGHGVDLSGLTWQTDNGAEFLENQDEQGLPSIVRALGSDHRYTPPSVTPGRAMSKRSTAWSKTSSLIGRPSVATPTSGPRSPPTGITSTWSAPIAAKNGKAPSRSSRPRPRPWLEPS
jgi:hypothetical protein